jgi:glycerol-3-phosphate acyltransferase PlsY
MIRVSDIVLIVIAYMLGSIPTSVWIGRFFYGTDVRHHGSGNAGATNTLRTLGKSAGLVVLLIDMLKGWLAVGMIYFSGYESGSAQRILLEVTMAVAAILGHIFPIYAGFKGGKGVATTMGIIIGISPLIALLCAVIFALVLIVSHYVSLASILSVLSFPFWMMSVYKEHYIVLTIFSLLLPMMVIIMHRKNIIRLLKRQESAIYVFRKGNRK